MTASPAALLALASAVEAGTGPDRELDARIAEVALGAAIYTEFSPWQMSYGGVTRKVPKYTAKVDAALALFEQVLPGWGHSLWRGDGNYYPGHNREVSIWCPTPRGNEPLGPHIHGSAPTLPRAIVATVLRAAATITPQEK